MAFDGGTRNLVVVLSAGVQHRCGGQEKTLQNWSFTSTLGFMDGIQAVRLAWQVLPPLSHLAGLVVVVFMH